MDSFSSFKRMDSRKIWICEELHSTEHILIVWFFFLVWMKIILKRYDFCEIVSQCRHLITVLSLLFHVYASGSHSIELHSCQTIIIELANGILNDEQRKKNTFLSILEKIPLEANCTFLFWASKKCLAQILKKEGKNIFILNRFHIIPVQRLKQVVQVLNRCYLHVLWQRYPI